MCNQEFMAQALCYMASEMYSLALARCHVVPYGPDDRTLFNWMNDPGPGDMVVEWTSLSLSPKRVGRMLAIEEEDGYEVYYIVGIDGEVMRWTNCTFIRIPDPVGYPKDVPNWRSWTR